MTDQAATDRTLLATLEEYASAGVSLVADWVARIVERLQGVVIAPLALMLGCQQPSEASKPIPQPQVSEMAPIDAAVDEGPRQLGQFNITFYYVIGEDEVAAKSKAKPPANDNQEVTETETVETDLATVTPPDLVTIYASGKARCEPITEVSREFAHQLNIQGTGKLRDGRVLNVWGACNCETSPCFKVTKQQWGTGGAGKPLQPFRTVAVDPKLIKLGSLLYVPLLEGRVMPGRAPWGGFVHDGCVVADDTGGGIKDNQLDLFVGRRGWFLGMSGSRGSHAWARHVPVFDGAQRCERKGRRVARKAGAI